MAISFERSSSSAERRRLGRAALQLEVSVRERSRTAMTARLIDLTSFGAQLDGVLVVQPDAQLWVRLPGLGSLAVRIAWCRDGQAGVEFETPLHPAVAARFLPAAGSHAAATVATSWQAADPLLSRREQIIAGIAANDHSPLQRKKRPSGLGIDGKISRTVARQVDTRAEPRFADAVPEGTALRIEGVAVAVVNVSSSGMRISGAIGRIEIGDEVVVEFTGFEPMDGRLVWLKGSEAGIALPPESIELFDRVAS